MRGSEQANQEIQRAELLVLTPVVVGELRAGFKKGRSEAKNQRELDEFLASPRAQVVSIDDETAGTYAVILVALWKAGTPIPTNDLWIAASAMQHGLPVLTADDHFKRVPQIQIVLLGDKGG